MTESEKVETKPGRFETDKPLFRTGSYVEDPDWKPSPFDQYGTVRTAGTAGDNVHGDVSEVSPVFRLGRAHTLVQAARGLDPEDPTPPDLVILPNADHRSEDVARDELFAAARKHLDEPVDMSMTWARQAAAEGVKPEDAGKEEEKPSGWQPVEGE